MKQRSKAVTVVGISDIVAVAAGKKHSLALDRSGRVWVWGDNTNRQLARRNGADGVAPVGEPAAVSYSPTPLEVLGIPVPVGAKICEVSSSGDHCLVRDTLGNVYGWGSPNDYSQLGLRASPNYVPLKIPLIATIGGIAKDIPAYAIAAGGNHSLALTAEGVFGWGYNAQGQAGNKVEAGNSTKRSTPGLVSPFPSDAGKITAIAAGENHSLALSGSRRILGWGQNAYYQLGDNTITNRSEPVYAATTLDFASISAGARHSAAVRVGKDASSTSYVTYTWGNNAQGQLGNGTGNTPAKVPTTFFPNAPAGYVAVEPVCGAYHTFLLYADYIGDPGLMRIKVAGDLAFGQLGDGTATPDVNRPSPVFGISTAFVSVAAGPNHSYAIGADGLLWAWGDNNVGQLAVPNTGTQAVLMRTTPQVVSGMFGVCSIATSSTHSVALKQDGTVWTWGANIEGQLGNGTTTATVSPTQVSGLTSIVAVACSKGATVAIRNDGAIWQWGSGTKTPTQLLAAPVAGAPKFTSAVGTLDNTATFYFVRNDGRLFLYGQSNGAIQWMGGMYTWGGLRDTSITNTASVAVGLRHIVGLRNDGTAFGYGAPTVWMLSSPTISAANAVGSGHEHAIVGLYSGSVLSWGRGDRSQLGVLNPNLVYYGNPGDQVAYQSTPKVVSTLTHLGQKIESNPIAPWYSPKVPGQWQSISGGFDHTIAVDVDGYIWVWGRNDRGQLGFNDLNPINEPKLLPGLVPSGKKLDSDGDGLLDRWERMHFGNLDAVAIGDEDEDNVSNLDEMRGGTSPVPAILGGYAASPTGGSLPQPSGDELDSDDDDVKDRDDAFPSDPKLKFQRYLTPSYFIINLGPGEALDVNDKGEAVGSDGSGGGFFWKKGTLTALAGSNAFPQALNNVGQIAGMIARDPVDGSGSRAAFWQSPQSAVQTLGVLPDDYDGDGESDFGGIQDSYIAGLSESGVPYGSISAAYGYSGSGSGPVPVRYNVGGNPTILPSLQSGRIAKGSINGVTKAGNPFGRVGAKATGTETEIPEVPVFWDQNAPETTPFNVFAAVDAVPADTLYKTYLAGAAYPQGASLRMKRRDGGYETFQWGQGTITGINEDGIAIGFDGNSQPLVWNAGEATPINSCLSNTRGWKVINANAINADGMIAGCAVFTPMDESGQPIGPAERRAVLLLPVEFVTRNPDTGIIDSVNPLYAESHPIPRVTASVTSAALDGADLVVNLSGEFVDRLSEVLDDRDQWVQSLEFVVDGKHVPEAAIANLPNLAGNRIGVMPWQPHRSDITYTKQIRIPNVSVGSHSIRVVTGNNAVGNSGFSIVNVIVTEDEIPGVVSQSPFVFAIGTSGPFASSATNTISVSPFVNAAYAPPTQLTESGYVNGRHTFSGNLTVAAQTYSIRVRPLTSPAILS